MLCSNSKILIPQIATTVGWFLKVKQEAASRRRRSLAACLELKPTRANNHIRRADFVLERISLNNGEYSHFILKIFQAF
jgi:hypothetical protein